MDSLIEQRWSCFLPWTKWRFVRHSHYGLLGEWLYDEPRDVSYRLGGNWDEIYERRKTVPTMTFDFLDFDGQPLKATTRIEEREWRAGEGWFKWLSWFRKPLVQRSLDIDFSGETGKRKGSWKGGTTGHSIEMQPGELHYGAFVRYCIANDMTFTGFGTEASPASSSQT